MASVLLLKIDLKKTLRVKSDEKVEFHEPELLSNSHKEEKLTVLEGKRNVELDWVAAVNNPASTVGSSNPTENRSILFATNLNGSSLKSAIF